MEKELITRLHKNFEDFVNHEDGVEFWFARDLQQLLSYTQWRNFEQVIEKAKLACQTADQEISDHFADVSKMVDIGSGSNREIADIKLTRYACYLIAQNGDPKKEEIAFAQTYFAIQTRKQEIIEQRLAEFERVSAREKLTQSEKILAGVVFERGVDQELPGEPPPLEQDARDRFGSVFRLRFLKRFADYFGLAEYLVDETLPYLERDTKAQVKKTQLFKEAICWFLPATRKIMPIASNDGSSTLH